MKILPRKFRESQMDWFAKGGISCHLTVSTRGGNDLNLQMMTFVNVFKSCSQESCTVLSVMYVRRGNTTLKGPSTTTEHLLMATKRRLLPLWYNNSWRVDSVRET